MQQQQYGIASAFSSIIAAVFEAGMVFEYCDVEKHGNYRVVSSNGRVASGVSRIFLRLKKTPHGI